MGNRRVITYVVIAIIVGASLAMAVALASGGSSAPEAAGTSPTASASDVYGDSEGAGVLASDPAKEEPLLDKFTSKDPFVPLTEANTTSSTSTDSSTTATSLTAKIKIDGTSYSVVKGDKVPGGDPAFEISAVTSGDVTFAVIDGSLKNGDSSVTVNVGESVKATVDGGSSYTLTVVSIGSSSSSSGSTNGHSIQVVSISSQNGTAMATFEVDDKTYADKKKGDTFTTSWGEIKVVAIDVDGQTVTIMHGDQTFTLSAGQVIVK